MRIYTIGFTQKSAETFFGLLDTNKVSRLLDIRLNPSGQLAGFAKKNDLPYFLYKLVEGCQYLHIPELAPTEEMLENYRKDKNWRKYEDGFAALMDERQFIESQSRFDFEKMPSCLLCSEATPEKCHRRLVAERIAFIWEGVEIIHL